jgi:hypothetical protein
MVCECECDVDALCTHPSTTARTHTAGTSCVRKRVSTIATTKLIKWPWLLPTSTSESTRNARGSNALSELESSNASVSTQRQLPLLPLLLRTTRQGVPLLMTTRQRLL